MDLTEVFWILYFKLNRIMIFNDPIHTSKIRRLKSLAEVSQITGVAVSTLNDWHRTKPDLFKVVIAGCVVVRPPKQK